LSGYVTSGHPREMSIWPSPGRRFCGFELRAENGTEAVTVPAQRGLIQLKD
jgi:hypothetical protein